MFDPYPEGRINLERHAVRRIVRQHRHVFQLHQRSKLSRAVNQNTGTGGVGNGNILDALAARSYHVDGGVSTGWRNDVSRRTMLKLIRRAA